MEILSLICMDCKMSIFDRERKLFQDHPKVLEIISDAELLLKQRDIFIEANRRSQELVELLKAERDDATKANKILSDLVDSLQKQLYELSK